MMFGHWCDKKSYYKEVVDVLEYLGVDSSVENITIVRKRALSDEKVILRLSFGSAHPVAKALASAKKLNSYNGHKVFISKDLSYAERI